MNCEDVMDRFLELDKHQRIPAGITVHLLFCRACRTRVRLLTLAEKSAAQVFCVETPLDDALLCSIMERIAPLDAVSKTPVSLKKWVIAGLIMIAALLCFPVFSFSLPGMSVPGFLTIAFYLLFACAVTAYCALFIGSNMDFFIKQIELAKPPLPPVTPAV